MNALATLPAPSNAPRLLSEIDAAAYIGVSVHTLRLWRAGRGSHATSPGFVRIGSRAVRYDRAALDAWIEANTINPT